MGVVMHKYYYTYADLMELLSCSKSTLEKKIPKMNIRKRYFNGGRPKFLVLDVHSYLEYNKAWNQCTQKEKQELKELLYDV